MSKHTPGPWKANKPTQSNGRAEVHAGPMLVAQAFNWMLDAEGDEQCWADARLIAAAPAMFAALQEILVMTEEDTATFRRRGGTYRGLTGEIARAAIAKAEGA